MVICTVLAALVDMARPGRAAAPHLLMVTARLLADPGAALWLLQSPDANSVAMAVPSCISVSFISLLIIGYHYLTPHSSCHVHLQRRNPRGARLRQG
jgi:hypothetical protein